MLICIVGKGQSYTHWKEVEAGFYISCNSAIEKVRSGFLVQRDPGHIFDFPEHVGIVAPMDVCIEYGRGFFYAWEQIPKLCTACTAIYLAHTWGADEIVLVGFDNLMGDATYHDDFPQTAPNKQWQWGLEQQIAQFQSLPDEMKSKCILQPFNKRLEDLFVSSNEE